MAFGAPQSNEDVYTQVMVASLILNEKDQILLIKRSLEPYGGMWSLLSANVRLTDDNLEHTVVRRTKEETGLDVRPEYLVGVVDSHKRFLLPAIHHSVTQIVYVSRVVKCDLRKSRVAADFMWVDLEQAKKEKLAFNHNKLVDLYSEKKGKLIPVERTFFTENFGLEYSYDRNDFMHMAVKGICLNAQNEILMVHRTQNPFAGYWDLPGGHMYSEETTEECLRREVLEEVGADCEVGELFNIYSDKGMNPRFAKAEVYYFVKLKKEHFEKSIELDDFKYFSLDNLPEKLAYQHASMLNDLKKFLEKKI